MTHFNWLVRLVMVSIFLTLPAGCSWFNPQTKPAPQAVPDSAEQDLTYLEKVKRPPQVFFVLTSQLEDIFKPLQKMDFTKTQTEFQKLEALWKQAKAEAGNIKGVSETDEALQALGAALTDGKAEESMASLNKLSNNLQELLTNYKLSPLSDIVNLSRISRNISWELEDKDFEKSLVHTQELEKTWDQSKVNLEQSGILSEVIKAHDSIPKIKGAITAENKMVAESQLKKFNENLSKIRNFYQQKNLSRMP